MKMYFIIKFDILPGKMNETDTYINKELVPYWTSHKEVRSVQVFEDTFIGWPERMLMIEIDDLTALQQVLASGGTRHMKEQLISYATDIQTQVVDRVFKGPTA
ncbi:MAG TPA: hypothetical protein VMW42_01755 [Desulfatiglandales bacterium]|nr:hypothetical protein [Desulfatiglandales bacterium]